MSSRIASAFFITVLLTSCGKEKVIEKIVEVKTPAIEINEEPESKKDVVKTAANIVYKKERKTSLLFDSKGKILNGLQYVSDLNKRKIIASNEGRVLEEGELRCYDSTDPNLIISHKKSFKEDGTRANFEFKLNPINKEHKITCSVYENDEFIKGSSADFIFYEDIQISGIKHFNDLGLIANAWNKVGALVLNERSRLLSGGEKILINAEEVIAFPGSEITTFSEEEFKASPKNNGKHGGVIEIKTKFTTGELKIIMRGQDGGDMPADFRPSKIENLPPNFAPGNLDGLAEYGNWIKKCDDDDHRCFEDWIVEQSPTSGKDGYKGLKGSKGFRGMKGGHSGIFKLTAEKDLSFQMNIDFIPGKGSSGGIGGLGGPGSPGGKVSCSQNCNLVKEGAPGSIGDIGESGEAGEDGDIQYGQYLNQEDQYKNVDFNMYR